MNAAETVSAAPRSLAKARDDLRAKLRAMPLDHPGRGKIAQMVVRLEDEIESRGNA